MMTKKQKKMVARLGISAVCLIGGIVAEGSHPVDWALFLASYLAAGYDIPLKALRNIRNGQVFDENFLMTVATFGAIGVGELEEAVAVMLFYQVGELFNDYAVNRSRKSITNLMDINPDFANVIRDGREEQVEPDEVEIGEIIVIKPGEKVALVGPSGGGKTTLCNLIPRFYDPASGEILLDGKPISELDTSVCISYVDQNEYIFQAGLEDNVTVYGSYPSIRKQILDRYWIRKQDNAGESDCQKMSGGEKQIIAFLRVVARDASIIIMDEPFSAMDAENTEKIQDYLLRSKEMSGKTVILITHDISAETLAKYDCIVRVNEFHCEL